MQAPKNQTKILKADSELHPYLQQQKLTSQQNHKHRNYHLPTINFNKTDQSPLRSDGSGGQIGPTASGYLDASDQLPSIVRIQRKLLAFFYIYATLIVTLYLTYAIYCYYQHTSGHQRVTNRLQQEASGAGQAMGEQQSSASTAASQTRAGDAQLQQQQDLEHKLHLLERYIEVIALDLEETKGRLREREKCACSLSCSFNGTQYQDGQMWQQKCDTCACRGGKISCSPSKCPKQNCDNPVQLDGKCCPTCMKNCKVNKTIVKHGQTVKPKEANGMQQKQCRCNDGLIRCEPISAAARQQQQLLVPISIENKLPVNRKAQNKTMEYLRSIIAATPQLALKA